ITHGGVSTINEALVHGVPLIVINAGHVDQPGCTARVVHHGVGLACDMRALDPIELGNHIDYILGDTGKVIRENVENMRTVQIEHDEQRTAVNFLRSRLK
ncbi:MAG: glycosyltransferase, partial [Granulosicoccus sp.]